MSQGIFRDWATLQASIDGEVALPGSPLYEHTYKPFNARFHEAQPIAIVRCATSHDVVETISFFKVIMKGERTWEQLFSI